MPLLLHSITVRTFIFLMLLSLALAGHPPVLCGLAAVAGIGVADSLVSCLLERTNTTA